MTKTVFWFALEDYASLTTAHGYPNGFVLYHSIGCDASLCIFMVP